MLLLRAGILVPTCAYQRRDHAVVRYHRRPYQPFDSIIILLLLLPNVCYVVEQQHAVIIERLGKFNRIVNAGFHMKVPVIDRKAATVSLRTMKNGFGIDVKTQDNVTIGLESLLSTREL